MRANAACSRCYCRWHLQPNEANVRCDRKIGTRRCGGLVVRGFEGYASLPRGRRLPPAVPIGPEEG